MTEESAVATEPTRAASTTTATTAIATGGLATGATVAEVAHADEKPKDTEEIDNGLSRDDTPPPMPISPVTIRETEPKPRASSEVSDSKWKPVSVPTTAAADGIILGEDTPAIAVEDTEAKAIRPPFEQKPSLSGLRNDDAENSGTQYSTLERHISQIPESDDDDDDDVHGESRRVGSLGSENAQVVANRVTSAPVTDDPASTAEAPLPTNAMTDETLSRLDEQRAEPPKGVSATGAATTTTAEPAVAAAPTTVPATSTSTPVPEKKEKGVRGLLNKIRHKRGDSDTNAAATSSSSKSGIPEAAGAMTVPPSTVKSTPTKSTGIPEAAGARTIPPVDVGPRFTQADSSDEEDNRGRKGARDSNKLQKKMGFGNSRTTTAADKDVETAEGRTSNTSGGEETETFEEARDHFDESLAPPPAFGGQAKNSLEGGSPSRGTKFQEEL